MNRYSILDQGSSQLPRQAAPSNVEPDGPSAPAPTAREPLRFPGDDGGKSLTEMARRDLHAALQLLAERAQYITGASGAAIALLEGAHMICSASAGPSAPGLGARLQVNSGLSGESVRARQILRCDDAETDARVNRESCRALGIASVVVMPLMREQEVTGVFELFSGKAYAFEERDITALQRIAEMIQTAVEHAEALKRAEKEINPEKETVLPNHVAGELVLAAGFEHPTLDQRTAAPATKTEVNPEPATSEPKLDREADQPQAVLLGEPASIRKCAACGFPVSGGRTLCLDCEAANTPAETAGDPPGSRAAPVFLSEYTAAEGSDGWLRSHKYLVGALLFAAMVVAALLWLR